MAAAPIATLRERIFTRIVARRKLWALPQQLVRAKDRAVCEREAITPVAAGKRNCRRVGLANPDAAGLTRPHPAGHGALDCDLAFNAAFERDLCNALHHRFGATGIDEKRQRAGHD